MKKILVIAACLALASCLVHIPTPQGLRARGGHAAVLHKEQILLLGGSSGTDDFTLHRYEYLVRDFPASPDGRVWTPVMEQGFFYLVGLRALVHDGLIYATGGAYSAPSDFGLQLEKIVYVSQDGASWTIAGAMPEERARRDHAFVDFAGKFWILGGNLGEEDYALPYSENNMRLANDVWASSNNGLSWEQVLPNQESSDRWGPREGHAAVVFQDKLWLFGGKRQVEDTDASIIDFITLGDAWNTTDGIHWTFVPQTGDATRWEALGRAFHQVVSFRGALYLIGGIEISPKHRTIRVCNDIQKSTDGVSWKKVAEFPNGRYCHTATVKGCSIYIVGGRTQSEALGDVVIYTP